MNRRKLVFTKPYTVDVVTEDFSADPEADEIATETQYSLISPGTELMSTKDRDPAEFPTVHGYASVERVIDTGGEVEGLHIDDLVFSTRHHASHHCYVPAEARVVRVDVDVPTEHVPFARMAGVSIPSLQTTQIRPPAVGAVFGLGLVGNFAAQQAEIMGYDPIAFDPLAQRREWATACGIADVYPTPDDWPDDDREAPLFALECSGTQAGLLGGLEIVDTGGEVTQIGAAWEQTDPDLSAFDVQERIFFDYLTLRTGWEWQITQSPTRDRQQSYEGNFRWAIKRIAEEAIEVEPVHTHTFVPEEVQAGYDGLAEAPESYLGVLIDWAA